MAEDRKVHSLLARLQETRRLPKRARQAALVAALRVGDADEVSLAVAEALEFIAANGYSEAWGEALFGAWDRMGAEARASLCLGLGDRFVSESLRLQPDRARPVAASCLASPELHELLRGVGPDPIMDTGFVRLALSIDGLGGGHCRESRHALFRACAMLDDLDPAVRSVVDRELVEWAGRFDEHRDVGVLRAVLRATHRCGPKLNAWLTRAPLEEHLPLRSAASKVETATAAPLAIGWLGWPSLVPAARKVFERVASNPTRETVEALLEPWSLLRSRHRARRLPTVLPRGSFAHLARTPGLSAHSRQGLVAIADCLGVRALDDLLASGMVTDPDPGVRLRLICAISRAEASEPADEALQDLGFDRCEPIARASVGAISRVQSRHRRLASVGRLETLSRSPLRSVRDHAERTIERFDLFGSVRSPEARWLPATVASWMARRSPDTLRDELNNALGDASRVRAALSLVRRLGLADQSVEQVAGVAIHASDPSTRAQATLLLGRVSRDSDAADRAFRSLAELLGDDADRVRADAIEAMSRLRGDGLRLDRFAVDDRPRIRANAVLHGCRYAETEPDGTLATASMLHLDAMLRDDRPEHRISALWVARRIRPVEMATEIAGMARQDPDAIVRGRARRCAGRLLSVMEPGAREVGVG